MKNVLLPLLAAGVVYLLGAFANAGFDIGQWDGYVRAMVACWMAAAGLVTFGSLRGI